MVRDRPPCAAGEAVWEAKETDTRKHPPSAIPLGFIKFFDPSQAGISVEGAKGGVAIKQVAPDKPFARAGLRSGDVPLAIDGTVVPSPESFRRLLRRKLAVGKDAAFKVRRGEKTLEIRVSCKN